MAQKLFVPLHPQNRKNNILESSNRGVAQLVAFLVWDQAVAGSSPVTSTKREDSFGFLLFFLKKNFVGNIYLCIFASKI